MSDAGELSTDMRGKPRPSRAGIAERARRQHGVVARWQLMRMGFKAGAIDRMIAAGYLHPLHAGVYAVGHRNVGALGFTMAAVLSYGSDAVASHLSAAWLHGILRDNRHVTDVMVSRRRGRKREEDRRIVLHRPRRLPDEDRVVVDGVPCTSVARTLLDIAATRPRLLRRAFEEAERLRILDLREVRRVLERSRRQPGRARLARLVEDASGPPPQVRSDVERAFLELIRAEGLPMPATNAMVEGHEVDAVWFDRKLVVEIDHYATHGHRRAFERDRMRDIDLQIAGFRTARVTDEQIARPHATGPRIRRLLAA